MANSTKKTKKRKKPKKDTKKTMNTDKDIQIEEELRKVNKKLKKHSKQAGIKTETRVELEIENEMSRATKVLNAAIKLKYYVAGYTVALAVMAYYLGFPQSFFAHFIFGWFLLWLGHHFHRHHHKYHFTHKYLYIGLMIIPLYIIYSQIGDVMSLTMVILYMISFIVAVALYFHHTSRGIERELHQSFPRTFLIVWFSHVVAFATSLFMGYHLAGTVLPDSFVSITYVLLVWLVPIFLVYFFLNKFLYLRFFDPLHIHRDALKGLKHALAYTAMFVLCLALIYLLTGVNVVIEERDRSLEQIDEATQQLMTIRADLQAVADETYSDEIKEMQITQELLEQSDQLITSLSSRKDIVTQEFGLVDYFSDDYFKTIVEKRKALTFLLLNKNDALEATKDLIRNYKEITAENSTTNISIEEMRDYVETNYRPYEDTEIMKEFKDRVYASTDSYSDLVTEGSLIAFTSREGYNTKLNVFEPRASLISKKISFIARHLKIYRDMLMFSFENIIYSSRDYTNPEILDMMYNNRHTSESVTSKTVRYMILEQNQKALEAVR